MRFLHPVEVSFPVSQFCQSSDLILTNHNRAKLVDAIAARRKVTLEPWSGHKMKIHQWIPESLILFLLSAVSISQAQQKGQYVPGQYGLNAGVAIMPPPGFTFANLDFNYSANALKDSRGSAIPVKGTYSFWSVENIFIYVPESKILGGKFSSWAAVNWANGDVTADFQSAKFGINAGGVGLTDTWVQPFNLGWHFPRVDTWVGYAFVAPTGQFSPGSTSNNGSGYWGNNFASGTTFYVTKNKATQMNLATNWEFHGTKRQTNIIPGQAFTMEWGVGQIIPLKKDLSRLAQVGVIGYDQWQVTANQGSTANFPFYSMHAIGLQTNFIAPAKGFSAFFKYLPEYLVKASTQGRTFVFGFTWTLHDPRLAAPTH